MQWSVPSETLRGAVWEPALQGEEREECFLLSRVTSKYQGTASVASTVYSVGNSGVEIQVPKTAEPPSSFLKLLACLVAIHDPVCSEEQRASIWPRVRKALRKQLYRVNRSQTIMQTKKLIFMYDFHIKLVLCTHNSHNYRMLFICNIMVHTWGHSYSGQEKKK